MDDPRHPNQMGDLMTDCASTIKQFSPIDRDAVIGLGFDFSGYLGDNTLAAIDWVTISVVSGIDAAPETRLTGAPIASGAVVTQTVTGLQPNTRYKLRARITDSAGRKLVLTGEICVSE
jgi:hypothetical protein